MSDNSAIEWTQASWNPLLGCSRVSPGCDACYAINSATIRAGNPHPRVAAAFAGLTERRDGRLDWTGRVNLLPERLTQPLKWRKPKRIFVNSLADLFHENVPDDYIAKVFAVMAVTSRHTYQLLTKRHGRMRSLLSSPKFQRLVADVAPMYSPDPDLAQDYVTTTWPLPNVWLGVSVENQQWADIRIPALLDTPAAVRWLSCEPLLGPVDLSRWIGDIDGRSTVSRGGSVRSGEVGRTADRQPGQSVASRIEAGRQVGLLDEDYPLRTAAGRELDREVPPGPSDVQQDSVSRHGTPAGVAALRGTDSTRPYGQSQERDLVGQSASESGTCYTVGAGEARPGGAAARSAESVRYAELDGSTLVGAGGGDSGTASGRRAAADLGGGVRGSVSAHLADSAGRASISWIVAGGESGPGARPMHPDWARSLRDQCAAAKVPYFFKQWGEWAPNGWRGIGNFNPKRELLIGEPLDDAGHREVIERVGKKAAGRELDGRTWDEYPQSRAEAVARG